LPDLAQADPYLPLGLHGRACRCHGRLRGTYRGLGEQYDFTVPAGTLRAGANTISLSAASGSSGATFLSPNYVSTRLAWV